MKRLLSLVLIIVMVGGIFAGLQISSSALEPTGQCGDNVYYKFDESTGTLTISGTGEMDDYDYEYYRSPFLAQTIRKVIVKSGVTSIGEWAFRDCERLINVTIPNSVTSIGSWAFSCCNGLTNITIPYSVTSIGEYSFYGCDGLNNIAIPNSVTSIGYSAFEECTNLKSITIPNSVTSIGDCALYGCNGLTSIKVDSSNPVYDSRNNCNAIISTKTNTLLQGCKNTTIPDSVTSIGHRAFMDCSSLKSITIPNSVKSIEFQAFWGCSSLTNVIIPNSVTWIDEDAFWGCINLKSVTIPNSITSIGEDAFYDCGNLKIFGQKGSTAQEYANENNIPFVDTAHKHVYTSTVLSKATLGRNGTLANSECSICGEQIASSTIYAPKETVISKSTYTYSGKANKPVVTVKDSIGSVIDKSNYTVTYSNNINAGTAKVTVIFKGNKYEGSMSKTFKISPKKLTTCGLRTVHTYSGKAIVPTPYYYKTVKEWDYYEEEYYTYKKISAFRKNVDYSIKVSGGHKQVGTYTVVIKFKGNYTGTVKKTIQIRPKPVTKIKSSAYSATSAKFVWNKVKNITGYRVDRYNYKTGKWQKYKFTTKNSLIIPRSSAKDSDVGIRIFTYKKIGGKTYYNDGSKTQYCWQYTKPNKPIVKLKNIDFGEFNIIFNRDTGHQVQISDNRSFSNKGDNYCKTITYYSNNVHCYDWSSNLKLFVRAREYYYNNGKLVVGSWSDVKTITTL